MELKELQRRIDNKKVEITKIEKRIAKWTQGLRPQDLAILEPFKTCSYGTDDWKIAFKNYKEHKELEGNNIPSGDDWNKGPNFSEAYSAYIDLNEATATLNKYLAQLEKLNNFENEEKIEAIWTFLGEWETKVYNWYLKNAKHYLELKQNYKKARAEWEAEYLAKDPEPKEDDKNKSHYLWERYYRIASSNFYKDYYSSINSLTRDITNLEGHYTEYDDHYNREYVYDSYTVDTEKLSNILKEEKSRKYQDLVKRVTDVVGIIKDASNLSIGEQNGEINGIVVGDRGKAKVDTISAGGYNIQCFHYRVLVHKIKD